MINLSEEDAFYGGMVERERKARQEMEEAFESVYLFSQGRRSSWWCFRFTLSQALWYEAVSTTTFGLRGVLRWNINANISNNLKTKLAVTVYVVQIYACQCPAFQALSSPRTSRSNHFTSVIAAMSNCSVKIITFRILRYHDAKGWQLPRFSSIFFHHIPTVHIVYTFKSSKYIIRALLMRVLLKAFIYYISNGSFLRSSTHRRNNLVRRYTIKNSLSQCH